MNWGHDTATRTLYQECRGEPAIGQVAVAWVIRNRLESGRWGNSLGSCLWRNQFPAGFERSKLRRVMRPADSDKTLAALSDILDEVIDRRPQTDPTGGAQYYFASSARNNRRHGPLAWCRPPPSGGTISSRTGQMSHSPLLINSQDLDEDDIPPEPEAMSNTRKTPWARARTSTR